MTDPLVFDEIGEANINLVNTVHSYGKSLMKSGKILPSKFLGSME